jgi:hypothetical protein
VSPVRFRPSPSRLVRDRTGDRRVSYPPETREPRRFET